MIEIKNICMWDIQQFALLVQENGGKYVFMDIRGNGGEKHYYNRSEMRVQFEALAQLAGFGPVAVQLDLADRVPDPFVLYDAKTGILGCTLSTKKQLVEVLNDIGVKAESIKTLKKVTLKEMFSVTDASEPETDDGDEDNFEKIIKGVVEKNVVHFDSEQGKVTLSVRREGHSCLKFTVQVDWKEKLEAMLDQAKKAIKQAGLSLQNGLLGR